jgi:hypothetical protein
MHGMYIKMHGMYIKIRSNRLLFSVYFRLARRPIQAANVIKLDTARINEQGAAIQHSL